MKTQIKKDSFMGKKIILALAMLAGTLVFAQPGGKEKIHRTPEQRAENQLKEMTASLNLTEKQQEEMKIFLMEQAKRVDAKREEMQAAREKGEKLTDEQRAEMKKKMIDEQLATKTRLKQILTEEQLQKMKEIRQEKGRAMLEKRKEARNDLKK